MMLMPKLPGCGVGVGPGVGTGVGVGGGGVGSIGVVRGTVPVICAQKPDERVKLVLVKALVPDAAGCPVVSPRRKFVLPRKLPPEAITH